MKIIFFVLILVSFLCSDEMQRAEPVEQDIVELRTKYEKELSTQKEKNTILLSEIKRLKKLTTKYKKLIKSKEKKILSLKEKLKKIKKDTKIDNDENTFPELMLKDKYKR